MKKKYKFWGLSLVFVVYLILCLAYIPYLVYMSKVDECYYTSVLNTINNSKKYKHILEGGKKDLLKSVSIGYDVSLFQSLLTKISYPFWLLYGDFYLSSHCIEISSNMLSHNNFEEYIEKVISSICINYCENKKYFPDFAGNYLCKNDNSKIDIKIKYVAKRDDWMSYFDISEYEVVKEYVVKIK